MDNEGTIVLLCNIIDLIFCPGAFQSGFVMLNFLVIQLQRAIFAVTHLGLLRKNKRLKDAAGFYTLHVYPSFRRHALRQKHASHNTET